MSKAGAVLERIASTLRNLGIKAPWKYTGPLSTPEYVSHLPKTGEYRQFAPASHPIRPVVPQAETDRVYDIKYYTRDTRRAELAGGTKRLEKTQIDPKTLEVPGQPLTAGQPYKWKGRLRSILDNENNGYTI